MQDETSTLSSTINWNKVNSLIPAVVQHVHTGQVLMLGYMSPEALAKTLESQRVTFFSRSRQQLWTKGETSGHFLELVELAIDCDRDTLLVQAIPHGPTCHTGSTTCFGEAHHPSVGFLAKLEAVIQRRKAAAPDSSYTATLFAEGLKRCAQKVGEEGVEVALAAVSKDRAELIEESADLLYHLIVVLAASDLDLNNVVETLQNRHAANAG